MAVEIRFTAASVAKVRFAISPLGETVLALRILLGTGGHAVHQPWVRRARPLLACEHELPLLRALIAGPLPSFLFPVPEERLPSMATELDLLRATGEAFFRREYSAVRREDVPEPAAVLPRLAEALHRCHELLIAPHWGRMRAVLEADIGRRALTLVDGGVQALFAELHRDIAWDGGQLVVHGRRTPHSVFTVDTGGHGLVLLPSAFNWPNVGVDKSPVTAASIRYPAVGVGLLWEPSPPALAGLTPVLGRTRTALLTALAEPLTTAALANRLGITPSAVSQHLGTLRGAGLVSTQRKGRMALHLRTERATHLLGTSAP
jgi:DNA-binding transcriptional ArsR family regulator